MPTVVAKFLNQFANFCLNNHQQVFVLLFGTTDVPKLFKLIFFPLNLFSVVSVTNHELISLFLAILDLEIKLVWLLFLIRAF
jgi:hypothetical protein